MSQVQPLDVSRNVFDDIRHVSSNGVEFWLARELMSYLGYSTWRNFEEAIVRAKVSCANIKIDTEKHFADTDKLVTVGNGVSRSIPDFFLSRYACYLIAQNGDPKKVEVAAAQAYFAVQTRRQELMEQEAVDDRRIAIRERLKTANSRLYSTAKKAGVTRYGIFQDEGYKGLYGGKGMRDLMQFKGIPDKDEFLDRIGPAELAANEFRATQAEERLKRDNVRSESEAFRVHNTVGQNVRAAIRSMGNTLPEDLPVEPDIKAVIAKKKREAKLIAKAGTAKQL